MPQGKRVWVGKKKFNFLSRVPRSLACSPRSLAHLARALADVFRKNEKKNKTTSGYRLYMIRLSENEDFRVHKDINF